MSGLVPGMGSKAPQLEPFAKGSTEYPTPINGSGANMAAGAAGGNTSVLTPIPKTGYVSFLRHTIAGTLTIGTVATTAYVPPLHRLISNYNLSNSLNYPYRNLNGDDVWAWANFTTGRGEQDPIYGSKTLVAPSMTALGAQPFAFTFVDRIGQNDGVNFARFLLSALTTSNDLTISVSWLPFSGLSALQQNGCVISAYTATDTVSAMYMTVPNPQKYYQPNTGIVQQVLGDPTFNNPQQGVNAVNLTPIQGPEFLGLGVQVVDSGGAVDSLVPGTSGISQIEILVNGTVPIKTWSLSDVISKYEELFGRMPSYGYLYLDMSSDLSIPNVMSHVHRKVLSTAKYAQITVQVTLNSSCTAGAGAKINLLKRTQQRYAGNG